jgi:uncharacterized Zn-finger protein
VVQRSSARLRRLACSVRWIPAGLRCRPPGSFVDAAVSDADTVHPVVVLCHDLATVCHGPISSDDHPRIFPYFRESTEWGSGLAGARENHEDSLEESS